MNDRAARLQAGRKLATIIGSADGREMFRFNGHRDGAPITVVLEGDCLSEVYERVFPEVPGPPATVAIYYASADNMEFITLGPSDIAQVISTPAGQDQLHDVHRDATIGALFDYMRAARKTIVTVNVSNWKSAKAQTYDFGSAKEDRSVLGKKFTLVSR